MHSWHKSWHRHLKMPCFQGVCALPNTVQVLFPALWETGLESLQTSFTKSPSFCHQFKSLSWYNGNHHFQGEAPVWFHISAYGDSLNGVGTPERISPGWPESATARTGSCWTATLFAWMCWNEYVKLWTWISVTFAASGDNAIFWFNSLYYQILAIIFQRSTIQESS